MLLMVTELSCLGRTQLRRKPNTQMALVMVVVVEVMVVAVVAFHA